MKGWYLSEGSLLLHLNNDSIYHPTAKEIYEQKDSDSFVHEGLSYAPLSETKIRFSSLTVNVKAEFIFDTTIKFNLYVEKNASKEYVSTYNNIFNDYIICNGVWRYINPIIESINSLLLRLNINVLSINYHEYILLKRELYSVGIDLFDEVFGIVEKIKDSEESDLPKGLIANLYPYQLGGAQWLDFMVKQKCGCILGDEMGLGKTLQIIAVMGMIKERKSDCHFLVVCPLSLLENWRREILKFYPSMTVNVHNGNKRTGDFRELKKYDVNIMSYGNSVTDSGLLTLIHWDLLVVDEAQNIKNPRAKRTRAIKNIKCDIPIAVTGTPFENHMTDIWSLIDFVLPGYLGNLSQFENRFSDDIDSAQLLEKYITPLIIRRKVLDVAKDLPNRVDIPQPIIMTDAEAILYENSRLSSEDDGDLKSMQLSKIQKLRTFCTHPCVYDSSYSAEDPSAISTKYSRLCELLEEILYLKEKVVIFTSFIRMRELMVVDIKRRFNVYVDYIDGSVDSRDRQLVIDRFSSVEGSGVLILNPKAAGAGLNITCANHVIHYNLEWNPAVEDQASARVYRRGQDKVVFVHRLFYSDTIEEIINEKIQSKRVLSENAIVGNQGDCMEKEYLFKALSISPYKK